MTHFPAIGSQELFGAYTYETFCLICLINLRVIKKWIRLENRNLQKDKRVKYEYAEKCFCDFLCFTRRFVSTRTIR